MPLFVAGFAMIIGIFIALLGIMKISESGAYVQTAHDKMKKRGILLASLGIILVFSVVIYTMTEIF